MNGIAIYENQFMEERYVRAVGIREADYTFEAAIAEDASVYLSGYFSKSSQAKCSKKDTYDFETGALIALMKMCGFDKVCKAVSEAFPKETAEYSFKFDEYVEQLKLDHEELLKGYNKNIINKKYGIKDFNLTFENVKVNEGVLAALKGYDDPVSTWWYKLDEEKPNEERLWTKNKPTSRQRFWRDLLKFDGFNSVRSICRSDQKSFEKWVRVPVWAIDEFERWYTKLKTGCPGLFSSKKVIWDIIKAKKLDYIYIRVTNWDKYLVWCDEKPYEGCAVSSYIPINTSRMFKRNKYCLKVFKDDWAEFRNWCINSVGIEAKNLPINFPSGLSFIIFRYAKDYNDVEYSFCNFCEPLSNAPTYSWEDMR